MNNLWLFIKNKIWLFSKSLRAGDFEEWLKSGVNMPIAAKIAVVQ